MANQFAEGSALIIHVVDVVDKAGNPADLATPPTWTTSDNTVLAITPAPDGMSASGVLEKTGTVTITATSGDISASVAITGVAGDAVSFDLEVTLAPTN